MITETDRRTSDAQIVSHYLNQPAAMPADVREAIERAWGDRPVQLYAMIDLDPAQRLVQHWLALGPEQVAIVRTMRAPERGAAEPARKPPPQAAPARQPPIIATIERSRIKTLHETPGLSCTVLSLLGEPGEPPLAVIRYTHRQRRAFENIKFVLEQQFKGYRLEPGEGDRVYAQALARPVREAQASVAGNNLAVMWRLLAYLRPYRRRLGLGLTAAASMTALSLVPPYVTKRLIDNIVHPYEAGAITAAAAMKLGWVVIGALATIYLIREGCLWVRLRAMTVLGEYVARDLRRKLYEHLHTLSLSFYSSKQTGSIISRVSHDTDRLWDFIVFGVVEVTLSSIMLVGLSIMLVAMDWRLGLVMVLPVPVLVASFFMHSRTMQRLFLRAWRKWSGLTDVLGDTIPGMRVVKAFNQERREVGRFNDRNENCLMEFNSIHTVWTKFWPRMILGLDVMALGVWFFALPRVLSPADAATHLTFGTFMAFLLYMGMFFQPLETIGMLTRML
ncbi:MAG: ABC transporter transmembrane domain-containing protein, partial [bacterium]|nr:ABC transporter transmembrane domain-containing protein [bacterium]